MASTWICSVSVPYSSSNDSLNASRGSFPGLRVGGAARCHQVVDDQHDVVGGDGVDVDLQRVGPVLELERLAERLARQFSRLAGGYEPGIESAGDRRAHHEAARLRADHLRHAASLEMRGDRVDDGGEAVFVGEQGRDVLEHDAAHHEAARLRADHLRHAASLEMRGDRVDDGGEAVFVGEQGRDVLEHDARLRVIRKVDDQFLEIELCHTTPGSG